MRHTVEVGEIKEVRRGEAALNCKDYKASSDYARASADPKTCFVIMHGKEFRLKQLCLQGWSFSIPPHPAVSLPTLA